MVNLSEICTTKRSWKDLYIEGLKLNPLSYVRLDLPPLQLLEHLAFVFLGSSWYLSTLKQCTWSCKFSYSLRLHPICMRKSKILNVFLVSFWTLLQCRSNLRPPSLLVWFTVHSRNYLSWKWYITWLWSTSSWLPV